LGIVVDLSLNKGELFAALRAQLEEDLALATASHRSTTEGATHEESRAENDKDTRGLEASYLARGLAKRVGELKGALASLTSLTLRDFGEGDAVGLAALVTLEDDDGALSHYLLAPTAGGVKLDGGGATVRVVTPESPLGRALVGRREGDDVEIRSPKGVREAVLLQVR
jgi:transcription elongation GreA/GreB family factor